MGDELISRQAALELLEPYTDDIYNSTAREIKEGLQNMPSVTIERQGEEKHIMYCLRCNSIDDWYIEERIFVDVFTWDRGHIAILTQKEGEDGKELDIIDSTAFIDKAEAEKELEYRNSIILPKNADERIEYFDEFIKYFVNEYKKHFLRLVEKTDKKKCE